MEEKRRRYQATIMSAVDELQRCYRALNTKYYNGELENVVITIQSDTTRRAYAWITVGKTWKDNKEETYHEINIVAEYLNREPKDVIASLLHEMAHLYNMMKGIQDCSRGGTYHNEKFKEAAEAHGLNVEHSKKYGWTITSPNIETILWVEENVRKGCFRMTRKATWTDGTPKKTGEEDKDGKPTVEKKKAGNSYRYYCPKCGIIVRASKEVDNKIMCVDCMTIMVR